MNPPPTKYRIDFTAVGAGILDSPLFRSSPVRHRSWQFFLAEALIGISRKLNLVPEGEYGSSLVLRLPPAGSKGKTLGLFLLGLFFAEAKKSTFSMPN